MAFGSIKPCGSLVEFCFGGAVNYGCILECFSADCFEVELFFKCSFGHGPVIEHAVDGDNVWFVEL